MSLALRIRPGSMTFTKIFCLEESLTDDVFELAGTGLGGSIRVQRDYSNDVWSIREQGKTWPIRFSTLEDAASFLERYLFNDKQQIRINKRRVHDDN